MIKTSKSIVIARAGVTAALYIALTAVLAPVSFGTVQFRASEALTVLPLLFPECAVGLTIGCLVSNLIFSTPLDVALGTTATFLASLATTLVGFKIKNGVLKIVLGELPPILFNAVIVPFTFLALSDLKELYFINALTVGLGQLAVIATLGTLVYFALKRYRDKSIR